MLNLSGPALQVNARKFEAPDSAPLLAVVLDDAGNGAIEADALSLLTMPLTLAIRPEGDASVALARAAHAANHEVLAQLPMARTPDESGQGVLRSDQSAGDLRDTTLRHLADLDVAIGATPPEGALLTRNRDALQAIIGPIADHGFAYLDLDPGIGSEAERLSTAAGVVYAGSDRFVPAGKDDAQVFTSIENAAFQARQKGTAIVYITASREALTALLRWGLVKDRRPVWFAPVSAVIARRAATQ